MKLSNKSLRIKTTYHLMRIQVYFQYYERILSWIMREK
jgi:hypothetical protein